MTTLDNLRKSAKRWLKALRAGERDAWERLYRSYPKAPAAPGLRDVQHALARESGHESWIALTHAVAHGRASESPLTALLSAAGKGDGARVAEILDEHPDLINERGTLPGNTGLRTALHFGSGHEAVVRTLLERGADPNIRDEGDNAFPIHFAAERGDLAVLKLLIEHGADPIGAGTTHELDVLGWAVCFGYAMHVDVARYLLAHGARHTLLSAVAMGDADAVRALAAAGADLNQRMDRTNQHRTALHLAVVKKQVAALVALVELGADLNVEDAVGMTPLDHAVLNEEEEMTRLLMDAGARITLPAAIILDRPQDIERLTRDSPDLLSMTSKPRWARLLVHASSRVSGRVIEKLLATITRHRAGLSVVNAEDDPETAVDGASGYTTLHSAAFAGNDAAVEALLRHGANPRARDGKYCGTPAGWAAYAGHMTTAELILKADVDIFDAINFDRADRVSDILDRDPGAIDRPFKAYASCGSREGQWWPAPECTPLEWATAQNKQNALRVLRERGGETRTSNDIQRNERIVAFLQSACWDHHVHGKADHRMYDRAAQRILAQDPSIARDSIYTAIVCGDRDEVAHILSTRPDAARVPGGPRGWTPILYLAYTRFTHAPTIENVLTIARLLLDHGADPNDFYMAGDARYSVLVGVAGEGEQDSPRQPYAASVFELLLERGAEPFDIQVLYNTHFSGDVLWWLELVYTYTMKIGRTAEWADPDWKMLDMGTYGSGARFLLETALKKRNVHLTEWLLVHGANPNAAPARDPRFPKHSLYQFARREGLREIADLLLRHGAVPNEPVVSEQEHFLDACFRLDLNAVHAQLARHPEYLQSPEAIFAAARKDRADVVALLLDLGVPMEIEGEHKQRPLHEAAANNSLRVARLLIERGAQIDPIEGTWGAAPIGWAAHGDHIEMVEFLSQFSRNVWTLAFRGYVERLRNVLREEPARAKAFTKDGVTPLWWLPDDETKALEIVELFLAHGADPSIRNKEGKTAADWALKRGMHEVAQRLMAGETAMPPAGVARYERLAQDMVAAYATGDAAAVERINEHYGRSSTADDLRAIVWRLIYRVRQAGGAAHAFGIPEAQELIARTSGFSNWKVLAEVVAKSAPPEVPPYAIDPKENKIAPRRNLSEEEWDTIICVMKERRITALDANGLMTDGVLKRIAELEHITNLGLGGSRELTDEGLQHLARMPQLEHLDLSEYPGGRITDRGLEVLRQLPSLRTFQMTWQRGISDAGTANLKFCEKLETVNLMGTPTGDGTIDALRGKPRLHHFDTGKLVTDAGLVLLHDFPMFKTWHGGSTATAMGEDHEPTHLLIDGPFTNKGLANLAGLDGVFALDLFWHVTGITSDGFEVLARLPNLASLGCDGELSDDAAMRHIASIPRLRKLRAQGTVATDDGFIALSRSASLEKFWGRECPNLTGRGFVALSKMPALRSLGVSCKNVDDEALSCLPRFPALRELTPIDVRDEGFRHVGRCSRLERLSCMYCRDTTDVATQHIAGLQLKTYYAGLTKITDLSLDILGHMASLELIEFYETKSVTDAGLTYLARLPRLREIRLSGLPKVTFEGTKVFPARVQVHYWQ